LFLHRIPAASDRNTRNFCISTTTNKIDVADTYVGTRGIHASQRRNRHSFVGQSPWLLPLLAKVWAE
jgi:hypothetical protein